MNQNYIITQNIVIFANDYNSRISFLYQFSVCVIVLCTWNCFCTDEISNHIGEVFAVTSQFAAALSKNVKLLQLVLKEHSNKPSVSLLNVMDSLVRLPAIRKTMDTMFLSVSKNKSI